MTLVVAHSFPQYDLFLGRQRREGKDPKDFRRVTAIYQAKGYRGEPLALLPGWTRSLRDAEIAELEALIEADYFGKVVKVQEEDVY